MTPARQRYWLQRLAVIAALCLTAACATQVQQPGATGRWAEQRTTLEAMEHWTAKGKVAVSSQHASESASMVWQQRKDITQLRLSGPVGVGNTTVTSDGKSMEINRGGERRTVDISSPEAIARETGWDLPLAALPFWLRALPAPQLGSPDLALDSQTGTPVTLEQDGWLVRYGAFNPVGPLLLPARLDIQRGDTRARLVIRQWLLDPGSDAPGPSETTAP